MGHPGQPPVGPYPLLKRSGTNSPARFDAAHFDVPSSQQKKGQEFALIVKLGLLGHQSAWQLPSLPMQQT
ncbi:hypothetical protein R1flu_012176 [Riccia fluitans]|uniref:Uncharacterized protein n=1 Tax=Riccia fluitans TaxID=41844 RepID=A0ABD1ZB12_9MARC